MPGRAKLEIVLSVRNPIAIDQEFLAASRPFPAADQRMLAAFAVAHEIRERSVLYRYGGIVLPDAPRHFLEQLLLQFSGPGKNVLRIGILVVQVGADRRVEQR